MKNKNDIKKIYEELRESFCVIGLTGAIGSGCTTTAKFLSQQENYLLNEILSNEKLSKTDNLEPYRKTRITQFLNNNKKENFYHIKVSNLLFCLFFASDLIKSKEKKEEYLLNKWFKNENNIQKSIDLSSRIVSIIFSNNNDEEKKHLSEKLKELDSIIEENVEKSGEFYTKTFQKIGNDLRKNGIQEYYKGSELRNFKVKSNVFTISEFIRLTIHHLRDENHKFFVIDALRNLFEINFFKARYANFFLFSINAEPAIRKKRLLGDFAYKENELIAIQKIEQSKKENNSQNINICISNGDVFIENNSDENHLYYQLIKYTTLIRKPGLFTPTSSERYMQIALTARYNSGCISRQVGACVIGHNGNILGVGWNDVPEKSIPCLYRTAKSLLLEQKSEPEFSNYETGEQFKSHLRDCLGPKDQPFCFKDFENARHINAEIEELKITAKLELTEEQKKSLTKKIKNPTRERALHAEEKAFLQATNMHNSSIAGATLYTTDSPCQLCAKKAMQLEIKKIIYIDAYPDISNDQTLKSGPKSNQPILQAFSGVAESAFMRLFKPLIGIKDELY